MPTFQDQTHLPAKLLAPGFLGDHIDLHENALKRTRCITKSDVEVFYWAKFTHLGYSRIFLCKVS